MDRNEKLAALRSAMKREGLDAYVVLTFDPHATEYLPDYWKCREWLSGFTGSQGSVVVTEKEAYLWADGRYYIQAEEQLKGADIKLQKLGLDGVPEVGEWLKDNLSEGATVGIDGSTIAVELYKAYQKEFKKKKLKTRLDVDLMSEIWKDRPSFPNGKAFQHDIKFAGKTRTEKLSDVRAKMKSEGAKGYIVNSLDDIAWLYNFRGSDTENMPTIYAFSYITQDEAYLFTDGNKFPEELKKAFANDKVQMKGYDEIFEFLKSLKDVDSVFIAPTRINAKLLEAIPKDIEVFEGAEITGWLKAQKSKVELENIRRSQDRDCAAVAKFTKWVKEAVRKEEIEEADVHALVNKYREGAENHMGPAFETIAGYMENAALMHYHPIKGQSAKLKPEGWLLIDTGGQYYDGTTDITRTIVLGEISDEMKKDFTLTLKAMLRLSMAKFMYGAFASTLDVYARGVMWDNGMDYKCGTGHGIGYCLNVHEGPPGFNYNPKPSQLVKLEEGMVITNEPGVYKEGKWGIRLENTISVQRDFTNDNGTFLSFEMLSFCPIDLKAIDKSLLSDCEVKYLNEYHAKTYEKLAPFMNNEEKAWLKEETRAI